MEIPKQSIGEEIKGSIGPILSNQDAYKRIESFRIRNKITNEESLNISNLFEGLKNSNTFECEFPKGVDQILAKKETEITSKNFLHQIVKKIKSLIQTIFYQKKPKPIPYDQFMNSLNEQEFLKQIKKEFNSQLSDDLVKKIDQVFIAYRYSELPENKKKAEYLSGEILNLFFSYNQTKTKQKNRYIHLLKNVSVEKKNFWANVLGGFAENGKQVQEEFALMRHHKNEIQTSSNPKIFSYDVFIRDLDQKKFKKDLEKAIHTSIDPPLAEQIDYILSTAEHAHSELNQKKAIGLRDDIFKLFKEKKAETNDLRYGELMKNILSEQKVFWRDTFKKHYNQSKEDLKVSTDLLYTFAK